MYTVNFTEKPEKFTVYMKLFEFIIFSKSCQERYQTLISINNSDYSNIFLTFAS